MQDPGPFLPGSHKGSYGTLAGRRPGRHCPTAAAARRDGAETFPEANIKYLRYLVGALDALAPPDGAVADVA